MDKTFNYLKELIKENDKVVLACSGGPDSMCLFHILLDLKKALNYTLIVAHMNHKQRIESEEEKVFVEDLCIKNNIPFEYYELKENITSNFHSEARVIRYKFLNEVIKKYKANYLMTAHHADDLMETILMRIGRGSNLKGYSGFDLITDKDTYKQVHPLIFYTKEEIKNYMDSNNYDYRIDKTNSSDDYTRNRYRNHMLPLLKKENTNIHEKYYKFSNTINEVDNYINRIITSIIDTIYINSTILLDNFNKQDEYIQKRIIEYILDDLYPDNLYLVTDKNTIDILNMIKNKKPNMTYKLPNNINLIKEYNTIYIKDLINNNEIKEEFNDYYENDNYIIKKEEDSNDKSNYVIRLDSNEIKLPLFLRTRINGDKMIVKNMTNSKKIKDILINEKVPVSSRNNLLLLVDSSDNILWMPGIKKSHYDKEITQKYDIIIKCEKKEGKK